MREGLLGQLSLAREQMDRVKGRVTENGDDGDAGEAVDSEFDTGASGAE